jgi:hypothetical protein
MRITLLCLLAGAAALPQPLALWRFQESAAPYNSTGTAGAYSLLQGNASHPIPTVPASGAPFGPLAACFGAHCSAPATAAAAAAAAGFNNSARLYAPRDAAPAITEGLSGPSATVTLVAWVSLPSLDRPEGLVAGVWDEYGVEGGATGARAYALFLNLGACAASGGAAYAGGLAAHISPSGGPSPGSRFCTSAACDARALAPWPAWHCLANTYDGSAIRAFVNGSLAPNAWRNPYNLTGGIFRPGPGRVGAEFGVGANRVNASAGAPPQWSNAFQGLLGGLAVWGSALAPEDVARACALARGF